MAQVQFLVLYFSLVLLFASSCWANGLFNDGIVELANGKILGTLDQSIISGREFYEFKGIQYGEPPVRELRFQVSRKMIHERYCIFYYNFIWQPPVKYTGKWEGIRESKYSEICPQVDAFESDKVIGNEDCLYLNVFVPKVRRFIGK